MATLNFVNMAKFGISWSTNMGVLMSDISLFKRDYNWSCERVCVCHACIEEQQTEEENFLIAQSRNFLPPTASPAQTAGMSAAAEQ